MVIDQSENRDGDFNPTKGNFQNKTSDYEFRRPGGRIKIYPKIKPRIDEVIMG